MYMDICIFSWTWFWPNVLIANFPLNSFYRWIPFLGKCCSSKYFYFYFYYITSQSLYSITRRIRISRLTTTPGSTTPTLYEQCVGSLTSHSINIGKDCETEPTVFRPYPRRLESLTICRCHYKGSTRNLERKVKHPTSLFHFTFLVCYVRGSRHKTLRCSR